MARLFPLICTALDMLMTREDVIQPG